MKVIVYISLWQYVAVCYSLFWSVAVCDSLWQLVAACGSLWQPVTAMLKDLERALAQLVTELPMPADAIQVFPLFISVKSLLLRGGSLGRHRPTPPAQSV